MANNKKNGSAPNNHNHSHVSDLSYLKYKICISGTAATDDFPPDMLRKTEEIGRLIAERDMVLVTGATTGAPYWAAKGAKSAGGIVIGISPAYSKEQHVKSYRLPIDYHDLIVYTGFGYSGRNLLLTRASDAVITVGGRIGTLNEFTDAFEDDKVQGVLLGSGGTTELLPEILKRANRGMGKVIFEENPQQLVEKVEELIKREEKGLDA